MNMNMNMNMNMHMNMNININTRLPRNPKLAYYVIHIIGLVDSGTGGLLEQNSFSFNITFTKMKIKTENMNTFKHKH